MQIEHGIEIEAPIGVVWELTEDVEAWPTISPTMTEITLLDPPPLAVGSRARVKQPGQRARVWTVSELEVGRRFAWSSSLLGTTMTGIHQLDGDDRATTNTLIIDIAGPLAPLLGRLLRRPILAAITAENEGFKAAAERSAAA